MTKRVVELHHSFPIGKATTIKLEGMQVKVTRPRGTNDILPEQSNKWQEVEDTIRQICRRYGYQELRTPIFEHTELFERGIGETTDIVEKEMYTFQDRGKRSITLRPEGTAPVVRSYIENKLYAGPQPVKVYYLGSMFRYERPQAGRYRQFSQFGVEAIGSADPALDLEMITLPIEVYRACGLKGFEVHINSIGCPACRPAYREVLKEQFSQVADELCASCQSRLERNPLRLLDCKVESCQGLMDDIPPVAESLCDDCRDHFSMVQQYLDALDIAYVYNPKLVRGFDYYTKTVFELLVPDLGAQNAVGGGGRYDGLVEEVGGDPSPAVGFAVGLERLLLSLEKEGELAEAPTADGFVAHFGGATKREAVAIVHRLRQEGFWVEMDYLDRSLRAQMKAANRFGVRWVLIIGDEELESGILKLRWMETGEEQSIALQEVGQFLVQEREG